MERDDFTPDASTLGHATPEQGGGLSGRSTEQGEAGFSDRARNVAGATQEKLADVGSAIRDRAGNLKDSLADALDSGANKIRSRGGQTAPLAGATDVGSTAMPSEGKLAEIGTKAASGMHATASWLRDADLERMKTGVERQVRDHPGRTLLIAVGVGYMMGKMFRR